MNHKLWLAASLTLNAILIGTFFFARDRPSVPDEPHSVAPLSSPRQPRSAPVPALTPKSAEASSGRRSITPVWQQSLPQLRDAGVPNDVLAGLVIAEFDLQWQKQLREFEQRYQAGAVNDDERARFEARRDDEQERALRTALGDAAFRQWDKDQSLRDLDLVKLQLSSSQTDTLYQLRRDRAAQDRLLAEALRNGEIDEADYNEQQSAAQREYDQQFKLLLGDERYEELQTLEEGMEGALRQKVGNLNLADSQFDAMLEAAHDEQYKQVLGTEGFDQLQRNQDHRYQLLKRYANTWSLSESDIDYVYSTVRHYRDQNPHARDQIEQSLIAYLGPARFERLKKNSLFDLGEQ